MHATATVRPCAEVQIPRHVGKALRQPVLILRPKDGLWEQTAQAKAILPGAEMTERDDWAYGIFDAYPQDIAEMVRPFLVR